MKKVGIVFLLLAIIFFKSVPIAQAQSALFFTVSPARQQIIANPGEKFSIAVTFYNQTSNPISGLIKVSDFIVEDESGTPKIIENNTQLLPKYSASTWIALPFEKTTIDVNNKVSVVATIQIPQNAQPGGHYAALYFEPDAANRPEGEAGASITSRIASLIYIRVSGPIVENAFISSMFSQSFYENGPIEVFVKIINKGDYHIRPKGAFTLFDPFGGEIKQSKLKEVNIFPESQYAYKTVLGEKWMMGNYKIALNAFYGTKDLTMTHTISVWVFPWRLTIIVVLLIAILAIFGTNLYKKLVNKETVFENRLSKEKEEIEKLKNQLR